MSLTNVISTKQTVVGAGVTTIGFTSEEVLSYADLYDVSFMGITLGGWGFILGLVSVLTLVILNAIKIGSLISFTWKHREVIEDINEVVELKTNQQLNKE